MNVKSKLKPETYKRLAEFERIGRNAVRKAREENRRLGLPNVDGRDGKLIFEMPDGKIIVKEIQSDKSESATKKLVEMARQARREIAGGKAEEMDYEKL